MLARRYQGRLDADVELGFSRIGGNGFSVAEVDLRAGLERVLDVLGPAVEDRGAVVTVEPLPTVLGDGPSWAWCSRT